MDAYTHVSHDSDSTGVQEEKEQPLDANKFISSRLESKKAYDTKPRLLNTQMMTDQCMIVSDIKMPLAVEPGELNFDSIVPGMLYVMSFSMRNATQIPRRMRVTAPRTKVFSVNYVPAGPVAPGLDYRAEIECLIPEGSKEYVFTDRIVVTMDEFKVEIPLIASKPTPDVVFEKRMDFATISRGEEAVRELVFENRGAVAGTVRLNVKEDSFVTFDLTTFELGCGESKIIKATMVSEDLGPQRELVMVNVTGSGEPMLLDISGQVVMHKVNLLYPNGDGIIDNIDVGNMLFGQTKVIKGVLVNNGPTPVAFSVLFPAPEDEDGTPQTESVATPGSQFVEIEPAEGVIRAFAEVPVTITIAPEAPPPEKGFQKEFLGMLQQSIPLACRPVIDVPEIGAKVNLAITGTASVPLFTITPSTLRFGECPVGERRDILVTFENKLDADLDFTMSEPAHFKISPNKGTVYGHQRQTFIASFMPSQLGKMKKIARMNLGDVRTVELRMVGDAIPTNGPRRLVTGIDKLPEDFKPQYQFVETEDMAPGGKKVQAGQSINAMSSTDFLGSESWDQLYSSQSISLDANSHSRQSSRGHTKEMEATIKNRTVYNNYLSSQRTKRLDANKTRSRNRSLAAGCHDREDPFGVDLGMDRGLDEPKLKVPLAGEPLWLLKGEGGSGATQRMPFDENRLVTKKYPKAPSTAGDMRDCTSELQIEDQRLVAASHTVVNFNEVCYTSHNWKNFAVTNSLQRPVLISLSMLEGEIKDTTPPSQVVPAGATANFDLAFYAKDIGKFKRAFMWTVNSQHQHKVTVVGEVMPIELTFDKTQLDMAFLEDSLEPFVDRDIVITNPGNAIAEFMMGKAGDFEASPDQGNIGPGESVMVMVRWTPTPGGSMDTMMSCHVPGGRDQNIILRGTLEAASAHFTDKKLELGDIAVGSGQKLKTRIKNTGSTAAVFIFEDGDLEQSGISITPDRGRLEPGETQRVDINVVPPGPMSYNKSVIHCGVRGGKSIKIALGGIALVPTLELQETSFDFGKIALGGSHCVPVTIINRSSIAANMVLDFGPDSDFTMATLDSNENAIPMNLRRGDSVTDDDGTMLQFILNENAPEGSKFPGGVYKIIMPAGVTYKGGLIYAPSAVKTHKFMVPLGIEGLHDNVSLQRECKAVGIPSRLALSAPISNFGDRVVPRDPNARMSFFKEVTIRNVDRSGPLSFRLDEDALYDLTLNTTGADGEAIAPIIFVSPTKGELAVGESETIRITFMPTTNAAYATTLNVFVSDQPSPDRPYLTLPVRGNGIFPRLDFDKTRVSMPVVPLGVTSRAQFKVVNAGYDSLDLNYRISPTIPVPLDVLFPDGKSIGVSQQEVRVMLAWKSDTATSWVGKVEFFDADGEKFCLEVSGCADNSILSNHAFINTYGDRYGFVQTENQPIKYATKGAITEIIAADNKRKDELRKKRQLERQKQMAASEGGGGGGNGLSEASTASTASSKKSGGGGGGADAAPVAAAAVRANEKEGIDLDRPFKDEGDADLHMLLKWLNIFVCKTPIDFSHFPNNIVESNGELVIGCVEQLSAKNLKALRQAPDSRAGTAMSSTGGGRNNKSAQVANSRFAASEAKLTQHRALLNMLIADGALLNHLNPMVLLSEVDYLLVMELELGRSEGSRLTTAMVEIKRAQWALTYAQECKYTWTEVLFQAVRVYSLGRVTYKELKNTPGVTIIDPSDMIQDKPGDEKNSKKKKSKAPAVPGQYRASNVYGQGEAVLLAWAKYHAARAGNLPDEGAQAPGTRAGGRRKADAIDFKADFSDLFTYLQVFHAHVPELASADKPLCGYTTGDSHKVENNYPRLLASLEAVQQTFEFSKKDLCTTRGNFILLLHLFFTMPTLVPKTTIDFKGLLGENIVKYIELKNPSKKQIEYDVVLDGSKDFRIESTKKHIVLAPMSTEAYPVTLDPRFSDEVTGRVTFWPRRAEGTAGTTLVFNLVSNIVGRKPKESVTETLALFEHKAITIKIKNPFDKECNFPVRLELVMHPRNIADTMAGGKKKKKKQKQPLARPPKGKSFRDANAAITTEEEADIARIITDPFWSNEDKITLSEGQEYGLVINALPFQLGTYTCQVILRDANKGEFCHEVVLETEMPKAEKLEFSTHMDQSGIPSEQWLKFSSKNTALEKATTYVSEYRLPAAKRIKARGILGNFFAPALQDDDSGVSDFVISVDSPFMTAPSMFKFVSEYQPYTGPPSKGGTVSGKRTAKQNKTVIEPAGSTGDSGPNAAKIAFFPERAGVYESKIIVHPLGNEKDVRVIELTTKASMKITDTAIEFRGAARQSLQQEIPVHNDGQEKWELQASVSGQGFSGPAKLVVPPGGSAIATINFIGAAPGEYEGMFTLKNPASEVNDAFEYKLLGIAEEPLAEGHLVFKCKARSKECFEIPLKKVSGSSTYTVETDLPYVSGAPTVDVSGATPAYAFSVNSPVGGVMSGSVTFTNAATGAMLWYTVDVEVTSPEAESVISVMADVRKAVVAEISLDNPLNENVHFEVVLRGEGLLGDGTYSIGPTGTDSAPYELIYSPLRDGTFVGSISFLNDKVGEFWYKVELTANAAPPVTVDLIECMVGDTKGVTLPLENPLGEPVTYRVDVSDKAHFLVQPDNISLGPYEQGEFSILFRPSSLTDEEHAEVVLSHEALGSTHFLVSGRGMMPGNMPPLKINAVLSEIGSTTVNFRNPFPHPLPVDVIYAASNDENSQASADAPESARTLESASTQMTPDPTATEPPFALLLRANKGIVVPAQSTLQIGISFSPSRLGVYKGFLQVRSSMGSRNLLWCFPLTGVTEVGGVQRWPRMVTQCKSSMIKEVTVHLTGLFGSSIVPGQSLKIEDFDIETVVDEDVRKSVKRAFRVQPVEIVAVDDAGPQVNYGIRCRVLFEPLKQLNTTVTVICSSRVRGQWRSTVQLESSAPDPDDVVELVATVGSEDYVQFRLSNRFLGFSQFQVRHTILCDGRVVKSIYPPLPRSNPISPSPTSSSSRPSSSSTAVPTSQWCLHLVCSHPTAQPARLSMWPSLRLNMARMRPVCSPSSRTRHSGAIKSVGAIRICS
jgi:hypothetical protein